MLINFLKEVLAIVMSDKLKSGLLLLTTIGSAVLLGSVLLSKGESQSSTPSEPTVVEHRKESKKVLDNKNTIEICLSDIESIHEAIKGEANSIELCVDRSQGGVTPSLGLIEQAVQLLRATSVAVHVLIRPRAGGFVYSPSEREIIFRDILNAKKAGADGIVFGALTSDGHIDKALMSAVRAVCDGMLLTFHRAFDICSEDLPQALETVIELGCDRILTSGKACSVSEGSDNLQSIVSLSKDRIVIVAGCGVSVSNVGNIIRQTGAHGVHAGSAVTVRRGNTLSGFSALLGSDMNEWDCVESVKVSALVRRARNAWNGKSDDDNDDTVKDGDYCAAEAEDNFDMLSPADENSSLRIRRSDESDRKDEPVCSSLEKSYIYVADK